MIVRLYTVFIVISVIAAVAARVLMALAVNFDCRARNLKSTSLFTALTLFFPVIVGIVYAAVRTTAEPNEKYCAACNLRFDGSAKICPTCGSASLMPALKPNAKQLAKTGVTLCIIGIIVFVIGFASGTASGVIAAKTEREVEENYSEEDIEKWADDFVKDYFDEDGETTTAAEGSTDEEEGTTSFNDVLDNLTFYDRNGKAYDSAEKVPFYDRDGNVYLFRQTKENKKIVQWYENKATGEKLDSKKCFVDRDGYFVYDAKGEFTLSEDHLIATDKDGNQYSPASIVIWGKEGNMISSLR